MFQWLYHNLKISYLLPRIFKEWWKHRTWQEMCTSWHHPNISDIRCYVFLMCGTWNISTSSQDGKIASQTIVTQRPSVYLTRNPQHTILHGAKTYDNDNDWQINTYFFRNSLYLLYYILITIYYYANYLSILLMVVVIIIIIICSRNYRQCFA